MAESGDKRVDERLRWQRIRRDYETTAVSWRNLAARYGYRSPAAIRRRAKAEGWARTVEAITARLVTRAVAAEGRIIEHDAGVSTGSARCAHGGCAQHNCDGGQSLSDLDKASGEGLSTGCAQGYNPGEHSGCAQAGEHSEHTAGWAHREKRCAHPDESNQRAIVPGTQRRQGHRHFQRFEPAPDSVQPAVADDDDDLSVAQGLADVHARAVREQVQTADRMLRAGAQLVEHVVLILKSEDEDVIRANARRLLLNPKLDSFHSVMDSATKLLNAGVTMKRRALAMDNLSGSAAKPERGSLPARTRMVLDQLDPDALMQVREASLRVSRLRPDEIVSDEEME
jgi:hypothetical protein